VQQVVHIEALQQQHHIGQVGALNLRNAAQLRSNKVNTKDKAAAVGH
jgi:hypothetical protein